MSEPTASPPNTFTAIRSFSHAPRGFWYADLDDGVAPVDLAEEFHSASKVASGFSAQALGPAGLWLGSEPTAPFELGRKALSFAGPRIALTPPGPLPVDLREVVHARRSGLPEHCTPVELDALATVLALSAGASPHRPGLRVIPSGGAMYPLDVMVVAHRVVGLEPGGYLYDPVGHALLPRGELDPLDFHTRASTLTAPPQPALTLAVIASFGRSRAKYGLRGYRFTLLEGGHLVQAALTIATALGLASCPWGGYVDTAVDALLELDGLERSCIYLLPIAGFEPGGADDE
jgi:SagB-type dehydrogenase family enzyme